MIVLRRAVLSIPFLGLIAASLLSQTDDSPSRVTPGPTHVFSPTLQPATVERIHQLKVPEGFYVNVFARDLGNARMMATASDGTIYLTCPRQGRVMRLIDRDNDGVAEVTETALQGLPDVHGILIHGNTLYLAAPRTVWTVALGKNGELGKPQEIINDLPPGEMHQNRTLGVGPDEKLYITVGSNCNACAEGNPESAAILRTALDGSNRSLFARGLRNTIGFGWHPQTGEMWGMDHGSDNRGDDQPPEELNRLLEGKDYGWPYAFGKRVIDPFMDNPPSVTKEEYVAKTEPAVLTYQAHSSPIGMLFYTGAQFPAEYRNDAFVVFRGSWNRYPPTGYKVARLIFDDGKPVRFEDFLTGFLLEDGRTQFGRLAGITQAKDGSLLISEDSNGVIYRVSHGNRPTANERQEAKSGERSPNIFALCVLHSVQALRFERSH